MLFGSADNFFYYPFIITAIMSFISTWIATALLLHYYSKKLGFVRYLIVVSLPLIYFVSQFQLQFLDLFYSIRLSNPVLFNIVYTVAFSRAKSLGGLLFGFAFWVIARSLKNGIVKECVTISGYGIMLLFISNQPSELNNAPYPPFGIISVSCISIASYLTLIGIFFTAIYVAHDARLRKDIRESVEQHSNLLDKIGTSQLQREILAKVAKFKNTYNEPQVLEALPKDEEIREYIAEVIEEITSNKEKNKGKGNTG
jgi:hypothetical protein